MRPSSLPDLNQVVEPGQSRTSTPTPLREALGGGLSGQDVGGLLQGVVEENEKLRRELEELKGISHPGGHGGQRGHGGDVPPALMSLLGRPTTTTGHWGVGGQVMQASNSQWSSEVSGMQAQGQVGRVASGVELLGQGVRVNLTSMFERMSLTACGGAGHQASNPLQVQGQDRGHGGSMGLGSPQQMDQGHQVCYGGLQGQHHGGLGGLAGQTQSAQPLEQGVHGSAAQKGKGYGWGCGSNPGGAGCGGQPSSGLSGFAGQGQAYGSQNVIMHGNMEVLVNMVMDKVSMPDRGVLGLGVRLVFLRESRDLVGLTILVVVAMVGILEVLEYQEVMGLQAVEMEMVGIRRVVMGLEAMEVSDQEDQEDLVDLMVDLMVEDPEDQVDPEDRQDQVDQEVHGINNKEFLIGFRACFISRRLLGLWIFHLCRSCRNRRSARWLPAIGCATLVRTCETFQLRVQGGGT